MIFLKHVASLSIAEHLQHCSQCPFSNTVAYEQLIPVDLKHERWFKPLFLMTGYMRISGVKIHLIELRLIITGDGRRIFKTVFLPEPFSPAVVLPGADSIRGQPFLAAAFLRFSLCYNATPLGDFFF